MSPLPFALVAVVLCLAGPMAHADDLPPLRSETYPQFTADVVHSVDAIGTPSLSVSISVPYSDLQWVKSHDGYTAAAELTVVFSPRGAGREYGEAWQRRLLVPRFESTHSPVSALIEKRTISVPPGRYRLRVEVRDSNAELASSAHEDIQVPDYSRIPVGFVDLELGTQDDSGAFTAVPARRFGFNVSRLAARASLFDRRGGAWPRVYPFRYRILDESGGEVVVGRHESKIERSGEPVLVRPDSSDLFVGAYTFEVELAEGRQKWRVERTFEVEESGPPRGHEFERMLEPLAIIAEPEEIEHLRALPPDRQAQGWEEFWKRRDPTPETPRNESMLEFFQRLRYVSQHFQSLGPGWRSDMGRVYIKYGPPDQTESRSATAQSLPLEIWYYNQPYRRFVFVDRDGFGRFVLANTSID